MGTSTGERGEGNYRVAVKGSPRMIPQQPGTEAHKALGVWPPRKTTGVKLKLRDF